MGFLDRIKELGATIAEDWRAHGKDATKPGFHAVAIHRLGVAVHQLPRGIARKPLVLAYRIGYVHCRNHYGIELPYSVKLGRRVVIEHQGGIVIHGNSVIGDGCIIRQGVTLGNRYLYYPNHAPRLGRGVNVGAGAKLLGDIRIGNGAAIGANSVVLRDVEDDDTVVGIPARSLVRQDAPKGAWESAEV